MKPTIDIPFALGVPVWVPRGARQETITCPECAGTKRILMTLGCGDQVRLPCENCRSGYDPSCGYVTRLIQHREPKPFTPREVIGIYEGRFDYRGDPGEGTSYSNEMFSTREECQTWCDRENETIAANERRRELACLESKRRDLAHAATYWRKKERELLRQLELVREKLRREP